MKTELVFIFDRSGSMGHLVSDTIGGFNSTLEQQKMEEGEATVTTVLFDNQYELLHDRVDIKGVAPITEKEYYVRGMTALLDAVGTTVHKIDNAMKNVLPEHKAEKVIFVITTDGYENASKEYNYASVKELIGEKQKEGWEFIFMGANIDSVKESAKFGINADRAVNFHADGQGVETSYRVMSRAMSSIRESGELCEDWRAESDEDFRSR